MIWGILLIVKSTSSCVLYRLRLKRIDPCAAVKGTPMARITCDGSSEPEVQADPDEAAMPASLRWYRMDSPSMYWKLMFVVLGSR